MGQCLGEAFDRLTKRLHAESKSLMMYRHDVLGTGRVCHRDRLLGGGMCPNPRIVGANAHNRESKGSAIAQLGKRVCHCSVRAVNDALIAPRNDITVVAAMLIILHTRTPMIWTKGGDFYFQSAPAN